MGTQAEKLGRFMRTALAEDRAMVVRFVVRETIAQTPVRTGFTRRQWKMQGAGAGRGDGSVAVSLGRLVEWILPVAWADRLAHGWSKQAKSGWIDRILRAAINLPGGYGRP